MRHLLAAALTAAVAAAVPAGSALAQGRTMHPASHALHPRASPVWAPPSLPPRRVHAALPDSVKAERKNHTVLGLVIGAGLGFAGGWAFYDVICEAVDNECGDSRLPHLLVGTAVGGGLGALIGSATH
jgi:hypothetical protein